jgi:uncharacterized membrane protein YgdD (TMEM256/DUF423 family)
MKSKQIILIAAVLGALAVILGAFGAHILAKSLDERQLEIFKLGVSYQYYHVPALLACGLLMKFTPDASKLLGAAAWCFLIGVLLFSGSLYLLATRDIFGLGGLTPIIGPMTPIGGLFFIGGWVLMAFSALKL